MKIVVNDIAASTGGAMTVLRDFYTFVCENDHENQWVFLLADRYFEETDNVKIIPMPQVKKSGLNKLWFDFVVGRRFIGKLKPDAVLSLQNIITFGVKAPQAVYIHQSIPFQDVKKFSFLRGAERKLAVVQHLIGAIIKKSAKKSDLAIVQANWMKEAVCRKCRISGDRVLVNMPVGNVMTAESGEFAPTQFFYPTAPEIYKNNDCLFKASHILRERGVKHEVYTTLPPEKSEEGITCTGRLPYEEVLRRYRTSTLVFPSYIESCALPLLEGRAAGAIVLAADTAFAREELAGYENAYFFNPFKHEELAGLMERVLSGGIERKPTAQTSEQSGDGWADVISAVIEQGHRKESLELLPDDTSRI